MRRTGPVALLLAIALAGCSGAPAVETRPVHVTDFGAGSATIHVIGVEADGPNAYTVPVTITATAGGTGEVRMDAPFEVGNSTRSSIVAAAHAAALVAGVSADAFSYDVRFSEGFMGLDGPSGGSQFALGFYVAINNGVDPGRPLELRDDYAGTGTILPDGRIGPVGGVAAKVEAVDAWASVFAYPADEGPVWTNWMRGDDDPDGCGGGLHCVPVGTLADLVDVATQPLVVVPDAPAGLP